MLGSTAQDHPYSPHPLLPAFLQSDYTRWGFWEDLTLADIVRGWAESEPNRIAVVGDATLTYAEVWNRAQSLAVALCDSGLEPGQFLVSVQNNCWQGLVLSVASSIAGIALSPLSGRISPTLALNLFRQVDGAAFLIDAGLLEREEWRDAVTHLRSLLPAGRCWVQDALPMTAGGAARDAARDLVDAGSAQLLGHTTAQRARDPGRCCLVLSTGGSTGTPKSVMHCEHTLIYAARGFAVASDFTQRDTYVAFGPYGHATGSLFDIYMPMIFGAKVAHSARWKASDVVDLIDRHGGTYCITVGTHIFDLMELDADADAKLKSMRLIVSGAGPDALFEDAEARFGVPIVRDYGLSECAGHALGRPDDPGSYRLRSEGPPFPGIDFRITNTAENRPCAIDEPGEYSVRGPSMFMGYLGQDDVTRATLTEDGLYDTGDLIVRLPNGYIKWVGRLKDVIRRGGLQIDILEMENYLAEHDAISEVCVVGEPHPRLGETATVCIIGTPGAKQLSLDDVIAHLVGKGLPRECLPERVVYADILPRTEWGKFNRGQIREWLSTRQAA